MEKKLQNQFVIKELRTIYWAEKYFLKVLPRLHKAACTRYLKACFRGHYNATLEHVSKLDNIFRLMDKNARGKSCSMLSSVISETQDLIQITQRNTLSREIGLIDAARQMESYEIDKYVRLINEFKKLNEFDIVNLLEEILNEEIEAEETFLAVKADALNDEVFMPKVEEPEFEESESTEE